MLSFDCLCVYCERPRFSLGSLSLWHNTRPSALTSTLSCLVFLIYKLFCWTNSITSTTTWLFKSLSLNFHFCFKTPSVYMSKTTRPSIHHTKGNRMSASIFYKLQKNKIKIKNITDSLHAKKKPDSLN